MTLPPHWRRGERGRGRCLGLALLLGLLTSACQTDPGPPGVPVSGAPPPILIEGPDGDPVLFNPEAAESLIVREGLPRRHGATLLFLAGRAATPLPDGGSGWADLEGDRVLIFDDRGGVRRVLQGGVGGTPPVTAPVSVIPMESGLRVEEREGGAMVFPTGEPPERALPSAPEPVVGGGPGVRLAARSVLYFGLTPVRPGDPLLWRVGEDGTPRPLGSALRSENGALGQLVNTGWAAAGPNGESYFAFALRPELVAFDGEGRSLWRASWSPEREVPSPRLTAEGGVLGADFSVVQHAIAVGGDGKVYVLAASRQASSPDRLLVFDGGGRLLREGRVESGGAILVDGGGRVFTLPFEDVMSDATPADRTAFPGFRLPSLDEEGWVDLEEYSGRVVVVNFWASWCPPCRREIPLLDELARELGADVAVVGLNEDARPSAGLRFLEELGGVTYANAAGRGELRAQYGYRGLPYTLVLDTEHRVVRSLYGFGTSIEPLRDAVMEALSAPSAHP
jgi:thiol-disulfide isomerase/thioredoxin